MTNPGAVEMLRTHYHEMRRMDLEELAEAMPDGPDKESVLKSAGSGPPGQTIYVSDQTMQLIENSEANESDDNEVPGQHAAGMDDSDSSEEGA